MTCDAAMEMLLERDQDVIDHALQAHLAGCSRCTVMAARLASVTAAAKAQYLAMAPRRDAEQLRQQRSRLRRRRVAFVPCAGPRRWHLVRCLSQRPLLLPLCSSSDVLPPR